MTTIRDSQDPMGAPGIAATLRLADGSVWSWGYNFSNQAEPVGQLLGVTGIKEIGVGYNHVLILKDDNTLWSYGDDGYGRRRRML